jgi:hypothetical protein
MKLFVNHANIILKAEASFGELTPNGLEMWCNLLRDADNTSSPILTITGPSKIPILLA